MSTLQVINSMAVKKKTLSGKIQLDEEIVNALQFIDQNTDATKSIIVEEALKKLGVVKMAKDLEGELKQQSQNFNQ